VATSPLRTNKNKLIFASCWLVWGLLHAIVLQNWQLTWGAALTDSITSNTLLSAVCVLVSNNLRYYRPRRGRYIYILVFCLALCGLWIASVNCILRDFFEGNAMYLSFLHTSLPIRFTIALLMTGCMALVSELWYTLEEYKETEERSKNALQLAKDAELYKLRQQLQPHFLFNSLNSISALVAVNAEQARKMIQQLSDFLRGTLKREENQWIVLEDELQYLQLYLDIEKVRFGHRLNTVIVCDEPAKAQRIPHMLLQPVVENAIKFGLYDTTDTVTIHIEATVTEHFLQIRVQNPFDPETSSPKQGTGFGLKSVQRRLYLLFARNDLLSTSAEKDVFTTTVKIPYI